MQTQTVDVTGKTLGRVDLPDQIFAAKVSPKLLAQAVRVYLSNQRRAHAKAKTRGEVAGSGRKIWRQKGTGKARHGDRYAPIFVGGGVAHGPTGNQNYSLEISKKQKRKALFAALTLKLKTKELTVVDGFEGIKPKTKEMEKVVRKFIEMPKKVTIIMPKGNEAIVRGIRNLAGVRILPVNTLTAYEILNGGRILLMKSAIAPIKDTFQVRTEKSPAVKHSQGAKREVLVATQKMRTTAKKQPAKTTKGKRK